MYSKLTFDELVELGKPVETIEDFEMVKTWEYTEAYATKKSVGRSEHYQAALVGLKPELIFVVRDFEYDNQERLKHEGVDYAITKVYLTDGLAELTVSTWLGGDANGKAT